MNNKPWIDPTICTLSRLIAESYFRWIQQPIISNGKEGDNKDFSYKLFHAPFILVAHGIEKDPIFNYANELALETWKMPWDEFVGLPSRLSAKKVETQDREKLLSDVLLKGFVGNYSGIRITKTKERFKISDTILFNLIDRNGDYKGQAALISKWEYL